MASDNKVQIFARIKPTKKATDLLEAEGKLIRVRTNGSGEDERLNKAVGVSYDFKFAKVNVRAI